METSLTNLLKYRIDPHLLDEVSKAESRLAMYQSTVVGAARILDSVAYPAGTLPATSSDLVKRVMDSQRALSGFQPSGVAELVAQVAAHEDLTRLSPMIDREWFRSLGQLTTAGSHWKDMAPLSSWVDSVQPLMAEIARLHEEEPERERRALVVLAVHGWYVFEHMAYSDIFELADALEAGDVDDAYAALCGVYHESTSEILADAGGRFPDRKRFFEAGIGAHQRGDYICSIPVLLAQIEGVCRDRWERSPFERQRDGRPRLAETINEQVMGRSEAAWLNPLLVAAPISAQDRGTEDSSGHLRRHGVMHGRNLHYDTKINGCRALSLLGYLSWVLRPRRVGATTVDRTR